MLTRKLTFLLLFMPLLLPSFSMAQNQISDTVYVFRFVSHKDMFYIPWKGNGTQLDKLLSLVETHKATILSGESPLLVDGYCASEPTPGENLKLAKIRSNRVKSELILGKGVNESCFITHNHAEPYGDLRHVVIVRLRLPKLEPESESEPALEPVAEPKPEPEPVAESEKETSEVPIEVTPKQEQSATLTTREPLAGTVEHSQPYILSLRANLLRWATLTPDLGIEWRISPAWSIQVNGSWTSWSWDNKNRRYALWNISPEVRYYLGKQGKGFLGAMYHTGEFHYKLGKTGRQGDYQGGGLTGGYVFDLNRSLSLDLHAGAGYTYADYDEYALINDVRVRKDTKTKNYWGINQLGITLIWKLLK